MLIMLDFFFDKGGLILICLFFLGALSFRVKDCLNNKRNFIISLVIIVFLAVFTLGALKLINFQNFLKPEINFRRSSHGATFSP